MDPSRVLAEVAADPDRIEDLPREELPELLSELEGLRARMELRLSRLPNLDDDRRGHAPETDDRLLDAEEVAERLDVAPAMSTTMPRSGPSHGKSHRASSASPSRASTAGSKHGGECRLSFATARQYHRDRMSERLAEAVRQILDSVPGSDRQLAQKAEVHPSTISRIRSGERGCTAEVAEALADALATWSVRCADAEGRLRHALKQEGSDE